MIVEEAFRWVRENHKKPFFLYLPFTIPHANLQVPDLGIYANEKWSPPAKAIAAMTTRMDRDIGRLLWLLKELGIDENTIVFFASDNGANRGGVAGSSTPMARCEARNATCTKGGFACRSSPDGLATRQPAKSARTLGFLGFSSTCAELAGGKLPLDFKPDGLSVVCAYGANRCPVEITSIGRFTSRSVRKPSGSATSRACGRRGTSRWKSMTSGMIHRKRAISPPIMPIWSRRPNPFSRPSIRFDFMADRVCRARRPVCWQGASYIQTGGDIEAG